MAVHKDQRHRKAADRRRNRRLAVKERVASREHSQPGDHSGIDLTEVIVEAILREADRGGKEFSDRTVAAALRSTLQLQQPGSPSVAALVDRLHQIESQDEVDKTKLRKELQRLLDLAQQYQQADRRDAFVSYLRVLCG